MAKFGGNDLAERLKNKGNVDSSKPSEAKQEVVSVPEEPKIIEKEEKVSNKVFVKIKEADGAVKNVKVGFWVSSDLKFEIDKFCIENDVKLQDLAENAINLFLKNGTKAMAKCEIDTMEEKQIFCRVSAKQKQNLRLLCLDNGLSIKEAVTKAIIKQIR